MIPRSRLTWIVYAICVLLAVEGLGWLTSRVLALEERERDARLHVQHEQAVRLALWQMDSAVAPLIAAEARRPYFHYRPFYSPSKGYADLASDPPADGPFTASPLLVQGPEPPIRLHFERSGKSWTSPQAPVGSWREQALSLLQEPERLAVADSMLAELRAIAPDASRHVPIPERSMRQIDADAQEDEPPTAGARDYAARMNTAQVFDPPVQQSLIVEPRDGAQTGATIAMIESTEDKLERLTPVLPPPTITTDRAVEVGALRAEWANATEPTLLFLREVHASGRVFEQGFWVDWPDLRATLLARVAEMLPDADLVPLADEPGASPERRLAVVPAVLRVPDPALASIGLWTPTRLTLGVTWLAVLSAVIATGIMLRQSESLSARRAQFVSAVTHELRTPLTTFCLYTQMLAEGLVPEERRGEYLGTLRTESTRLAGIVEDVLAYARLGHTRAKQRSPVDLADLVDRMLPTLRDRASRGGLDLDWSRPTEPAIALADAPSIERILSNLVDNACKYAADGGRIEVTLERDGRSLLLAVRDFGPGVPAPDRERIFGAFSRARRDADSPTPGLGLGLALARGLARESAGELDIDESTRDGARFVLRLPVSS